MEAIEEIKANPTTFSHLLVTSQPDSPATVAMVGGLPSSTHRTFVFVPRILLASPTPYAFTHIKPVSLN